ncbi:unnamed protein product [Heligmosomoides polygyrus]|uniref:HTH_Tnp_Tc3_1 domain-containing protein n=1 Tax=Heligmosomoides polygyrus TaxID=6339 RepID=A0A183G3N4_HELPZ|nr:unnamed protein product [Heligmosomoides polygyrus]
MSNRRSAILELHRNGKHECDIISQLGRLSPQKLVRSMATKVIVQHKEEIALFVADPEKRKIPNSRVS